MIRGLELAVGPVHPSEHTQIGEPYRCEVATRLVAEGIIPETCLFSVSDSGPGRSYFACVSHAYAFIAAD